MKNLIRNFILTGLIFFITNKHNVKEYCFWGLYYFLRQLNLLLIIIFQEASFLLWVSLVFSQYLGSYYLEIGH